MPNRLAKLNFDPNARPAPVIVGERRKTPPPPVEQKPEKKNARK